MGRWCLWGPLAAAPMAVWHRSWGAARVGRGVLGPAQKGSGGTGLAHTLLPSKSLERALGSPLAQCAHASPHTLRIPAFPHPGHVYGLQGAYNYPPNHPKLQTRTSRAYPPPAGLHPDIPVGKCRGGIQVWPCHWPSPADAGSKQLVMTIVSVVRAD